MEIIQRLSDDIEEEIADAKKYALEALELKESFPELAKKRYNVSLQEMDHMKIWHDSVVEIINNYRKEHGDPPPDMQARYDHEHKRHIKAAVEVRVLQNMYKEG